MRDFAVIEHGDEGIPAHCKAVRGARRAQNRHLLCTKTRLALPRDLWVEIPMIRENYDITHGKKSLNEVTA
jgi:hypothetical protein